MTIAGMKMKFLASILLCLGFSTTAMAIVHGGKEFPDFHLSMTHDEDMIISKIISTMGEHNVVYLLKKSKDLRRLGTLIDHVPPLQFLGKVFSDDRLKEAMRHIRANPFKWSGFTDGLIPNMTRDRASGVLYRDLPGFAHFLRCEYSELYKHAYSKNWPAFVEVLIDNSSN